MKLTIVTKSGVTNVYPIDEIESLSFTEINDSPVDIPIKAEVPKAEEAQPVKKGFSTIHVPETVTEAPKEEAPVFKMTSHPEPTPTVSDGTPSTEQISGGDAPEKSEVSDEGTVADDDADKAVKIKHTAVIDDLFATKKVSVKFNDTAMNVETAVKEV